MPWAGVRTDGTTFNAEFNQDSEGQWTITFDEPHPQGSGGWIFTVGGIEDDQRDNPKVTLVEGSDTASATQVMVTVDDNATAADIFEDNDFSLVIYAECDIISQLYVNGIPADLQSDDGGGDDGNSAAPLESYSIQNFTEAGFFFSNITQQNTAMNGQLQIFNTATSTGPVNWELRFDSNYDITSITPTGATAGTIQQTDNGTTYSYVIPMTGSIPGNNGNIQIAIQGERHPSSTDAQATHTNEGVYA